MIVLLATALVVLALLTILLTLAGATSLSVPVALLIATVLGLIAFLADRR